MPNPGNRRDATRAYIVFLVVVFALLIYPVYAVADRVFPILLGMPFGLFWIVSVEVAAFVALCGFYFYEHGRGGAS